MFKKKNFFVIGEGQENAWYSPRLNEIQINIGVLRGSGVGYQSNLPAPFRLGGFVAATLGHELASNVVSWGPKL